MKEKEYYNREELDEIMYSYIKETSKELKINFVNQKVNNKEIMYV